ncbi:nucleotidyltransferase family protein [Blastococcus sp. HT6-30]|uniref:nucleotidyltransferase family protein n=1 Tax=Blastococcus sp. HT6-30 TaxID=3144843 RepID=UPI00321A2ED4
MSGGDEERFLELVTADPTVRAVLDRAPAPGVADRIRDEARVHPWYEQRFGVPADPFRDCAEAIDHFSAVCCYRVARLDDAGAVAVYAPHGYDDLFALVVRPNPRGRPPGTFTRRTRRAGSSSGPSSRSCPGPTRSTPPLSTRRPLRILRRLAPPRPAGAPTAPPRSPGGVVVRRWLSRCVSVRVPR